MKDPELYALLHNIHRKNIKGHEYRGFMIENEKKIEVRHRPIYVQKISGLG